MASRGTSSIALFIILSLLFFTMVTNACNTCPHPKPKPRPRPRPTPRPRPNPSPGQPSPGTPGQPSPGSPSTPGTPSNATCPRDALKLGICVEVLNLVNITIGTPPVQPCCTLIQGLANLEAAICLCTAIRASILGININLPTALSLLLNVCGNTVPRGFQCA